MGWPYSPVTGRIAYTRSDRKALGRQGLWFGDREDWDKQISLRAMTDAAADLDPSAKQFTQALCNCQTKSRAVMVAGEA